MSTEEAKTELMVAMAALVELMAAELKAVNDLNEKLADRIEALEEVELSAYEKAVSAHGHWIPNNSWHRQNGI